MSPQFTTALVRSLYGGALVGAGAFLASYSMGSPLKASLLTAAGTLVAYLVARGGVEGLVDTRAAVPTLPPAIPRPPTV